MSRLLCLLITCLSLLMLPVYAAEMLPIVVDGTPRCMVITTEQPPADELQAATDLTGYLKKITGVDVPRVTNTPADVQAVVARESAAGRIPILVGTAFSPDAEAVIRAKGSDPGAFLLRVDGKTIRIAGLSPEGTYFGACELLEQLGVRWFMPGEFGTVIPTEKNLALCVQETVQVPSFSNRYFQIDADPAWLRHMRTGGTRLSAAHGINIGRENSFDKHPDYYALVKGKRKASQLYISNPEVLKLAIANAKVFFKRTPDAVMVGMGPNDGSGFCECSNCRALDSGEWDAFSNEPAVTDRYIWFYNQVLKGIEDEYPDKKPPFMPTTLTCARR